MEAKLVEAICVSLLSPGQRPNGALQGGAWEPDARTRRKKRHRAAQSDVESVIEALVALPHVVASPGYLGERPEVAELRTRADLVLDIRERALKIDDQAHERATSRHLRAARGWLPIGMRILAAVVAVAVIITLLLTIDRSQYDQLLQWICSDHATPYGVLAAVGGSLFAVGKKRRRAGTEQESLDAEDEGEQTPPV